MLDTKVLCVCDPRAGAATMEGTVGGELSKRRADDPWPSPSLFLVVPYLGGSHLKVQGDIQGVFPSLLDK